MALATSRTSTHGAGKFGKEVNVPDAHARMNASDAVCTACRGESNGPSTRAAGITETTLNGNPVRPTRAHSRSSAIVYAKAAGLVLFAVEFGKLIAVPPAVADLNDLRRP